MIYHRHRTDQLALKMMMWMDHKGAIASMQPIFLSKNRNETKEKAIVGVFGLGQMSWSTFTNIFVIFG